MNDNNPDTERGICYWFESEKRWHDKGYFDFDSKDGTLAACSPGMAIPEIQLTQEQTKQVYFEMKKYYEPET